MGSAKRHEAHGPGARGDTLSVNISVTDESGRVFEGAVELALSDQPVVKGSRKRTQTSKSPSSVELDLPLRPFLKKYARGKSGPAKLTLLLAHLAKGKVSSVVAYTDILRAWNGATAHLGQFNAAHTTRAKDKGWVDSPKQGQYVLRSSWTQALTE
jgi:hypothetical protein